MTSSFPKISVVTPSFNQGQYLEEVILSVIGQGYPNLEYIIIDGGSTDNSVEIIQKYEKHLAYWVSEKDNGLYHALNKGFEKATGEIMSWINSDDMYHRKSLFVVAAVFEKFGRVRWLMGSNTFFDACGFTFVYDDGLCRQRWSKWRLYLHQGKFIQQESVFWRRALWEEAGGFIDERYALAADFELWLRFFRYDSLYTTSFLLGGFRLRSGNQKSLELRRHYEKEVRSLLQSELKESSDGRYLFGCRLAMALVNLLPRRKWKERAVARLLKLTPRIVPDREKGMVLSRK